MGAEVSDNELETLKTKRLEIGRTFPGIVATDDRDRRLASRE